MPVRETTAREHRLLELANDHFGLLRHDHLVAAGLKRGAIQARLDSARLTEIHHCVCAFGHTALRDEGRWLAALWALGPGTTLSHLTAAAYFGWRDPEPGEPHTKSEFERRYLRFARRRGLPRPSALNVRVAGHKADCLYRDERLVIELDGRAFHRRRAQMRADRHRDADYQLAGFRILRLVWDDLHPDEAHATAVRIGRMLAAGAR